MYRLKDTSHNEIHMVAESRYVDLYDQGLVYVTSQEKKWSPIWFIFLPEEIPQQGILGTHFFNLIQLLLAFSEGKWHLMNKYDPNLYHQSGKSGFVWGRVPSWTQPFPLVASALPVLVADHWLMTDGKSDRMCHFPTKISGKNCIIKKKDMVKL